MQKGQERRGKDLTRITNSFGFASDWLKEIIWSNWLRCLVNVNDSLENRSKGADYLEGKLY